MISTNFTHTSLKYADVCLLKRRESLPTKENGLWQIETGVVRAFTLADDGTVITLGFWSAGDMVGQALSRIQPYHLECLTDASVRCLEWGQFWQPETVQNWHVQQVMLAHIHQMQELLRIRSGSMPYRLQQFLEWLAYKFGHHTDRGRLIDLWLTHQDVADAIGTTRVTVTRLLHQFERKGLLKFSHQKCILLR